MSIKIAVAVYGRLAAIVDQVKEILPEEATLIALNGVLEKIIEDAKELEKAHAVDIFVSSGGNARTLQSHVTTPVVTIEPTGFDLLYALKEAHDHSDNIGIITYGESLPILHGVKDIFSANLFEYTYVDEADLNGILDVLKGRGVNDIIGGSLAISRAMQKGMRGHYMITAEGVRNALQLALKMVISKQQEAMNTQQLSNILDFAYEGIIATDSQGIITVLNPTAEKITGMSRSSVVGKPIEKVLPGTRLHIVTKTGKEELNQIQVIGNTKVLTNRIPMINEKTVIGALATFQSVDIIEEAEEKVRRNLHTKGFTAKIRFENIVGNSREMRSTILEARRFAKSDTTLLIKGETGTGKELFAQSIHNASAREKKPFVAINCAAVPSQLLESELFGYEEGAFTGAKKGGKRGLFELADSGTIFLDEIAEISIELQARLLRVLEQREIFRIGSEKIRSVNIRVITATNKDLWSMVQEGKFRIDLYYRINVLELVLPALRERQSDIPVLAAHFLRENCPALTAKRVAKVAQDAYLIRYDWPGNVRELRNVIERYAILHEEGGDTDPFGKLISFDQRLLASEQDEEAAALRQILKEYRGNKSKAAAKLGISRTTLWRKLKALE